MQTPLRLLGYGVAGLAALVMLALLGLYFYLFYLMLAAVYGRTGAILFGVVYVGLICAVLYFASWKFRGKPMEERYETALRALKDQRWPGSAYSLLPGPAGHEEETEHDVAKDDRRG